MTKGKKGKKLGRIRYPFLLLFLLKLDFSILRGLPNSWDNPHYWLVALICFVPTFYIIMINYANQLMEKHKTEIVLKNKLMNASITMESYYQHQDFVEKQLTRFAKIEFFLPRDNRFHPNPPSILLKELKAGENKRVYRALIRAMEYGKKETKELGRDCTDYFIQDTSKYRDRISKENQQHIPYLAQSIKQYAEIVGLIQEADGMEGHEFEYWCADLLRKNGFTDVNVTPGSGDYGVDIIAIKDGIKYAIQCKCYSNNLDNTPVQEVVAGKTIYGCQIGVVMTNRHFTKGAIDLAEKNGILLWDREKLIEMLEN